MDCTLRELEAELKRLLKDGFFKNPQLSVGVELYRSQKIHVVGEIRNPGTYPLTGDMNLIEAIARAGSTLPTASGEALIVRAKAGKASSRPQLPGTESVDVKTVDLKALQSGALSQNVALRDGDTIFVPRAEAVYVFGQVKSPGAYAIQRTHDRAAGAIACRRPHRARRHRANQDRANREWEDRRAESEVDGPGPARGHHHGA